MLRVLPTRGIYWFTAIFVLPWCLAFNRRAVNPMLTYYKNRHGMGWFKRQLAVWRNHYMMAQMVIDRFAAYAGKKFSFDIDGNDAFARLEESPRGFILLSSHIGNTELVGYSMGSSRKKMASLVYSGESPAVMENRRRILAEQGIELVPVDDSFNHIYAMTDLLNRGYILGMPADRIVGSQKAVTVNFLSKNAQFPLGPFVTAVQLEAPMVSIFMMKERGKRYKLYVRSVELTEEQKNLPRRKQMEALAANFAANLQEIVKLYPDQWFNYYDFWDEMNEK